MLQLTSLAQQASALSANPTADAQLYNLYISICSLCKELRSCTHRFQNMWLISPDHALGPKKQDYIRSTFELSLRNAEALAKTLKQPGAVFTLSFILWFSRLLSVHFVLPTVSPLTC